MPDDCWPRWSGACNLELMDEAGISLAMFSMSSQGVHVGPQQ